MKKVLSMLVTPKGNIISKTTGDQEDNRNERHWEGSVSISLLP